jgi:hypothetical protein
LKKKYLFFIFFFQSLSLLAQTGAATDLAELKLRTVYYNRDSFLKPCVATPSPCDLTAGEAAVVNDVISKTAQFKGVTVRSAKETPAAFKKDAKGLFPLYSSEGTLGSVVVINRDKLLEAPFKKDPTFDVYVESMLSYLFLQQSNKSVPSQKLAKKIATFWGKLFKSYGVKEFEEDKIELLVYKHNEVRILLLDSYQSHVLNPLILKTVKCDLNFTPTKITNYAKIAWMNYIPANIVSTAKMRFHIVYLCSNAARTESQTWSADVSINTEFQGSEKKKWNSSVFLFKVNAMKKEAPR